LRGVRNEWRTVSPIFIKKREGKREIRAKNGGHAKKKRGSRRVSPFAIELIGEAPNLSLEGQGKERV